MKIRNIAFTILFILFISGPTFLWIGQDIAHLNLPSWITANEADYLVGNSADFHVRESLSLEDFLGEKTQASLEEAIDGYIPMRATAILANSDMQRYVIESASALFNWECYPTYYGSGVIYDSKFSTLISNPYISTQNSLEKSVEGLNRFGSSISRFASENPAIDIYIVIPNTSANISISPAWNLTSRKLSIEDCLNIWTTQSKDVSTLHFVYPKIDSYSDYLHYYYSYDDHWNGFGAILANESIKSRIAEPLPCQSIDSLQDYLFYGQLGRQGKMLIKEKGRLSEPALMTEKLKVSDAVSGAAILNQHSLEGSETLYSDFNFYSWLYGDDVTSVIHNNSNKDSDDILVICDSYGGSFRWVAAQDCSTVYSYYDLHRTSNKDNCKLLSRIEETSPSKIIFVGNIINYSTFSQRHPSYFN